MDERESLDPLEDKGSGRHGLPPLLTKPGCVLSNPVELKCLGKPGVRITRMGTVVPTTAYALVTVIGIRWPGIYTDSNSRSISAVRMVSPTQGGNPKSLARGYLCCNYTRVWLPLRAYAP